MKRIACIFASLLPVFGLALMSFTPAPDQQQANQAKKPKVYDRTKLMKYTIDPSPKKTQLIAQSRRKECPPLRPERFRRLMKMRFGIDINDYPKDALIWFGMDYKLSINSQVIVGYYKFHGEEPFYIDSIPENIYTAFGKYFIYYDKEAYQVLLEYIKETATLHGNYYSFFDMLLTTYNSSMTVPPQLMEYIDSMTYTREHKLYIFFEYEDSKEVGKYTAFRASEIKSNQVYLYIKEQESKGRVIRNVAHRTNDMINIGFSIDFETYYMPLYDHINPWHADTQARSRAVMLSLALQLKHKFQNKKVIQYMSGQVGGTIYKEQEDEVRNQIRSNNYYGYAILREFCENPEREMPTLEKFGTSFSAKVLKSNTLLYLEPYPDSYSIDTIQPTELFKAYEMGYDEYYFVEVIKPVESPVAGPNGYAMILDRTETVYGYIKKTVLKEVSEMEIASAKIKAQSGEKKRGLIDDPDGYANIRKEQNNESEIVGKIEEKELFFYWEIPGSNWWYVQTKDNIHGFVYKNRIKEKIDAGSWILDE